MNKQGAYPAEWRFQKPHLHKTSPLSTHVCYFVNMEVFLLSLLSHSLYLSALTDTDTHIHIIQGFFLYMHVYSKL